MTEIHEGFSPGALYDNTSGLRRPPAGAVGLSAVRALPDGSMRQYTAVEFTRGWAGVEHFIRTLRACGFVRPSSADTKDTSYAVLDVLDADGDIIGDYDVPDARAFRYIKRKLKLSVVDVEAEVAAYRAETAAR